MADIANLSLPRSHVSYNSPKAMWSFVGVALLYAQCITMRDTPSDIYTELIGALDRGAAISPVEFKKC